MRRIHIRRVLSALMVAFLALAMFSAVAENAIYQKYKSADQQLSFEVNPWYRIYEQDGFVWVYPGEGNSNFRFNWYDQQDDAYKAEYFAWLGDQLRAAMGDLMLHDPGSVPEPLNLRGTEMDAMTYAYTDPESGEIIEGAWLWEDRDGYYLLYNASYLTSEADAVLSALLHASQTVVVDRGGSPDISETVEVDFDALYAQLNTLSEGMKELTAQLEEAYRSSLENNDASYSEAMLGYVEACVDVYSQAEGIAAQMQAQTQWADLYGTRYDNALLACDLLLEHTAFYTQYYYSSDPLMEYQAQLAQNAFDSEVDALDGMYIAMGNVQNNYLAMHCPAAMKDFWPIYTRQIEVFRDKLYADYVAIVNNDSMMRFTSMGLLERQPFILWHYEEMMYSLLAKQYEVCAILTSGQEASEQVQIEHVISGEIYPNLYMASDSVINLTLYTETGTREVLVEAEVVGFSQKYVQKITVAPQIQHLMIKPPVLPDVSGLNRQKETQITLRITDLDTNTILAAESHAVTLHSLYDFSMYNNDFGIVEPYTLLAWLDPDAKEILELRRNAIDWITRNYGEGYESLPGYQLAYPADVSEYMTTYIQALGIQGAISDMGVRYNMGPYSFGASQRILSPSEVLNGRSGICVETALLVASALQSADMHPVLIITPGHAQVALETWKGSGEYFLLETTTLPFDFSEEDIDNYIVLPTADEWNNYLNRDGVYVIDCSLGTTLNIHGLIGSH